MKKVEKSIEFSKSKDEMLKKIDIKRGSIYIDKDELFCIYLHDLTLTYTNSACSRFLDKNSESMKNSFLFFILEEDRQAFQQQLSLLSAEHPVLTYECNTTNSEGGIVWYRWTMRAIFSTTGQLIEYQVLGRDITAHRQIEKALLEAKKRYEAVVEDQMELVCRYLPDCTLTFINKAYCNYHGKEAKELIGTNFLPTIEPDDREDLFRFLNSADSKHPTQTQVQRIMKNPGEILWVEWRRRALFDDTGKLAEIQSVGRDITELKQTEEALQERNKQLERKNVALTEVLEQIEQQKKQIKDDVITNVDELLIPVLDQLISKGSKLDAQYLKLIKRSLEDLAASFGRKITQKSLKLTPKEIQICNMIRRGLSSKEIADFLNISIHTVGRHRHSIRKKAVIIDKKENLYAFLQNL